MLNTNIKVRVSKALISDINNICQWKFPKRIVRQSCVCVCVCGEGVDPDMHVHVSTFADYFICSTIFENFIN